MLKVKRKTNIYIFLLLFLNISSVNRVSAQIGITEQNTNQGSNKTFSYNIKSTIGTQTSAEAVGNIEAKTEAIIKLKPGSIITNKFGDGNGNASATFIATPTGGNVDLKGITGENIFEFDEGTIFKSSLNTNTNLEAGKLNKGSASSFAIQDTSINVQSGFNTFSNTFEQTF